MNVFQRYFAFKSAVSAAHVITSNRTLEPLKAAETIVKAAIAADKALREA